MDDKQNITLDDILKESDDVELDPNLNISVADIINEPDDDVTEKIFQTLKENLPHPQTLPTQNSSVASESNKTQNSEQTSTKNGTSNTLSQSPLISKNVPSNLTTQESNSMSASVSLNVEVPRNERKIDDEILQQILKETEDINLVNNNNTTIDIDNLMHTMLLEEKMSSVDYKEDLFAQISAKEKQLINVDESKKLLEHLEQKRRKRKLQSNILDFMYLDIISKKILSPQMKQEAGIPCSIAISNKYIAVGMSHGFVVVFDHFHELKCVMVTKEGVEHGPVLSLDFSSDSEWIVCGHQGGQIVIWDITQGKPIKSITDAHRNPVVLVRFLKTKDRILSVDNTGVVNCTTITRILLVYSASTQCILSGVQGQVFSVAVLLPGSIPHPVDVLELVALSTATKTLVISFQSEKVKIVHQIFRPDNVREDALPYVAWRRVVIRETRGGQRKLMDPMLAIAWGNKIDLIQVLLTPKVDSPPRYNLEFVPLNGYTADTEICGLQWLGVNAMVFLTTSDELRVFDCSVREEVEISNVKHMELVYHTKFGPSRLCFANSLRSYKGHLYLLGLKGIWTGHLLTWSERLSSLAKRSQWLDALSLALDFYQGRSVGAEGLPRDPNVARTLVSKKIEELLEQFLTLGLSKNTMDNAQLFFESEQQSQQHHRQYLATVSIDYCIALGREDLLFNLVFPQFFKANEVGVFLERLEPFILGDKIQKLPPEVIKLLLHHYAINKHFRRLEQLILHIPIPLLDFHQVVTLCRKHYLMSALFYIFIQALKDYITPLDDLIQILLKIQSQKQPLTQDQQTLQKTIGYKVLLYLSYCFSGKSFPTEVPIDPERCESLRDEIFQYLLIESLSGFDWKYPRLHVLLQVDTKEFLRVVSISFDMNFSTSSSSKTSTLLKKFVNILLELMVNPNEEAFSWSDQPKNSSILYSPAQVGCFFMFMAQCFVRKILDLSPYNFNRVLSYLLLSTDKTTAKEREATLLSVVKSCSDNRYNQDKILQLAENAHFYKVCEYFYWQRKDFNKVFRCHLVDPDYKMEIFDYIRTLMESPTLSDSEKNAFKNIIIANLKDLIELNSEKASELIIEKFAPEHERVIDELKSYPQLQYVYLNAVLEYHRRGQLKSEGVKVGGESPLTPEHEEKLLELMCQFNPQKVLNFLQHQGSHYRLDIALQICQKHHVSEATAYLLERSGDLKGALKQHLNLIQPLLDTVLNSIHDSPDVVTSSDSSKQNPTDGSGSTSNSSLTSNTPSTKLEKDLKYEIDKAIALCQRNSKRLEESENEGLWFMLLDCLVKPWRQLKEFDSRLSGTKTSEQQNPSSPSLTEHGGQHSKSPFILESLDKRHTKIGNVRLIQQQRKKIERCLQLLNGYIQHVLDNMMGYVAMPSILKKIVKDHGSDKFGEFKTIFISMLDNYLYEQTILTTATHLFEYDTYHVAKQLLKLRCQARSPLSHTCQICKENFKPWNKVAVFQCQHAFHFECLFYNKSNIASSRPSTTKTVNKVPLFNGCPICGSSDSEEITTQSSSVKSVTTTGRKEVQENINKISQHEMNLDEIQKSEQKMKWKVEAVKTKTKGQEDVYKQRINKLVIPQEVSRYKLLKQLEEQEKETSEIYKIPKKIERETLLEDRYQAMVERTPGVLSTQKAKYTNALSEEEVKELFKPTSAKRK